MRIDLVPAASGDVRYDCLKTAVLNLDRAAAVSADDVVVMLLGLTGDVRVRAGWQVERSSAPSSVNSSRFRKSVARPT